MPLSRSPKARVLREAPSKKGKGTKRGWCAGGFQRTVGAAFSRAFITFIRDPTCSNPPTHTREDTYDIRKSHSMGGAERREEKVVSVFCATIQTYSIARVTCCTSGQCDPRRESSFSRRRPPSTLCMRSRSAAHGTHRLPGSLASTSSEHALERAALMCASTASMSLPPRTSRHRRVRRTSAAATSFSATW